MNPTILRLLSTYGPRVFSLLGASSGVGAALNSLSGSTQGDVLTDPKLLADIKSKTTPQNTGGASGSWAPPVSPPISTSNYSPPQGAMGGIGDPFGAPGVPSYPNVPMPQPRPPQAAMAQAPAPQVPMPQARPDAAPQMGFFQRNALMQKDPMTGQYLDPQAAASAQNSQAYAGNGSDLISKFLNYFHQKGIG